MRSSSLLASIGLLFALGTPSDADCPGYGGGSGGGGGGGGAGGRTGVPLRPTASGPATPSSGGGVGAQPTPTTPGSVRPGARPASGGPGRAPQVAQPLSPSRCAVAPLKITRGPTSRRWLDVQWRYPVFDANKDWDGRSRAEWNSRALPVEMAYREMSAGQGKPLLVVRECLQCVGSDAALLSRSEDNERTILLSRWFDCIKLPTNATEDPSHPFHNVFKGCSSHLFLAKADGTGRVDLNGVQSRREIWRAMRNLLHTEYSGKPDTSVKALSSLMMRFDLIDDEIALLTSKRESALARGSDRKLAKVERKLDDAKDERAALVQKGEKLAKLELRSAVAKSEQVSAAAASSGTR